MRPKPLPAALLAFMVLTVLLPGCVASGGADASYLLEQDYHRMTNPQLTSYEQELSDAIVVSSGSASPGVSLGFGVGSWGEHSGVGLGVDKWLGGNGGDVAVELRDRRESVRVEMRNRGLLPAPSN